MNWTKASSIAEILSSVAILVTLLYLVIEIGQNTEALQASSRQASLDADVQWLYQVANAPELWTNAFNANMTDAEKTSLSAFLSAFLRIREHDWLQYQAGALDEKTWLTYQNSLSVLLAWEQNRNWWDDIAQKIFDLDFVEYVNSSLEDIPIVTQVPLFD